MPTGQDIMERAGILLLDEDHVRWPLSELCKWINDGVMAIVLAKPSASTISKVLSLQQGTRQLVPTAGSPVPLSLIGITRNLKTAADAPRVPGRAVRPIARAQLDADNPNWHETRYVRFAKEVRHFTFDENNPLEYFVYPGNDGTGFVEGVVSVVPAALAAVGPVADIASYTGPVGLPEPYSVPLVDYVCFRAQSKDDTAAQPGRANFHYQAFAAAVGLKIQVERATGPNARKEA